jgi:hypothetical protein
MRDPEGFKKRGIPLFGQIGQDRAPLAFCGTVFIIIMRKVKYKLW